MRRRRKRYNHTGYLSQVKSPEDMVIYRAWSDMRNRCLSFVHPCYENYGGRGITICKRWDDFTKFRDDLGPKPTEKHTLDRVNNDENYEPTNCRWATRKEQIHNQRPPRNPGGWPRISKDCNTKEKLSE